MAAAPSSWEICRSEVSEQHPFDHLSFRLDSVTQEKVNIIKAIWVGNQGEVEELLERDPELIHTKFTGEIKSTDKKRCDFHRMNQGSLLHLACFIVHEGIARLLINRKPQLVNIQALPGILGEETTFGSPLDILVNHLSDKVCSRLFLQLLEAQKQAPPSISFKVEEPSSIFMMIAASKGKKWMIESIFHLNCQTEMQGISSWLHSQYSFPTTISDLVMSYASYVINPKILQLCAMPMLSSDRSTVMTIDTPIIKFNTPLHVIIRNLIVSPSLELVETAQFLLNHGAYFDNFNVYTKPSSPNRFSMCDTYEKDFPKGYLSRLSMAHNAPTMLRDELIKFQAVKKSLKTNQNSQTCIVM